MNEEALSLEAELSEEGFAELSLTLEERMSRDAERSPAVAEVQETMASSARQLMGEVEAANTMSLFMDVNPADQAQASARLILDVDPAKQARRKARQLKESLPLQTIKEAPALLEEDRRARDRLQFVDLNDDRVRKFLFVIGSVGIVAVSALFIWLTVEEHNRRKARSFYGFKGAGDDLDRDLLRANQTFLSLLMQAAADRPVDFRAFGISEQAYAALRASLCSERDSIANNVWWGMMADNAGMIYPPTGRPLTLGDHFLVLDFISGLVAPLYDPQPLDLDVDAVITGLSDRIDFNHPLPVEGLYRSISELMPEESGANRLQQIVLAQSAIARAIARRAKPEGS